MPKHASIKEDVDEYRETVSLQAVLRDITYFPGKTYSHLHFDRQGRQFIAITSATQAAAMIVGLEYRVDGEMRLVKNKYVMGWPIILDYAPQPIVAKPKKKHRVLKAVMITGAILFGLGSLGSSQPDSKASNAPTQQSSTSIAPAEADTSTQSLRSAAEAVPAGSTSGSTVKNTYTPNDCDVQSIPFNSSTTTNATMNAGTSQVTTSGSNGSKVTCYPNGRSQAPVTTVTKQPVTQITTKGTYVAPITSTNNGYTNVDGNYVPSPSASGATTGGYNPTFRCGDGTYSYAQNSRGACSHHGGIASRL